MSSYIIAGSADSNDTAYCEQIGRRIQAKYKNIDFRIVIKHPCEWEEYLQQICRIYGFLTKSNPIIYTFDGKIIGNKEAFVGTTLKYFGLSESSLILPGINCKINMKLAEEELARKRVLEKTLNQQIETSYLKFLQLKLLKPTPHNQLKILHHAIEYIYKEIKGILPDLKFPHQKLIASQIETVEPEDIDLMALSLHDQIKLEEPPPLPLPTQKDPFVTHNPPLPQDQRMSEVSRTNKMHQSMVSYDNNSKGVKESTSKRKSRIDEEFDDIADFTDRILTDTTITSLAENFYLAFDPKSYTSAEMIIFLSIDPTLPKMRQYNDNRPVKGHLSLIKIPPNPTHQLISMDRIEDPKLEDEEEKEDLDEGIQEPMVKARTDPHIPAKEEEEDQNQMEILSEPQSYINLVSNLIYHTLYIDRPFSLTEWHLLDGFIHKTDSIVTLQFLPENPNPKIKCYNRKLLLGTPNTLSPVENFITKQLEEQAFENWNLPHFVPQEKIPDYNLTLIDHLGFSHYLQLRTDSFHHNEEFMFKLFRSILKHMLQLQEKNQKEIGYNFILTQQFFLVVPIVNPYRIYNQTPIYLDPLAFLGYIQLPKLAEPFTMEQPLLESDRGSYLRKILSLVSGESNQ